MGDGVRVTSPHNRRLDNPFFQCEVPAPPARARGLEERGDLKTVHAAHVPISIPEPCRIRAGDSLATLQGRLKNGGKVGVCQYPTASPCRPGSRSISGLRGWQSSSWGGGKGGTMQASAFCNQVCGTVSRP